MSRLGFKGKLTVGGTEIKTASDVTISMSRTEVAIKNRESINVRYLPGLIDQSVEFDAHDGPATASLQAAFLSGTPVEVGFTEGSATVSGKFVVTKYDINEPVDDVATASVTLRPAVDD